LKHEIHLSGRNGWSLWRPLRRIALGIVLTLFALQLLAVNPQNVPEDQVKAAYLLNFAKLAEWPLRVLPDGPSPLVIGVSGGDEEFLAALKALVAGKVVGPHPVVVESVSSEEEMKSCHIVFFRASERKRAQAVIAGLTQTDVLMVGEDASFLAQGGMINLVRDHGSVRFEVNPEALDRSEIHFSSKILALAKASYGFASAPASNSPAETGRRVEHSTSPEYPEIAERMKLTGMVQVQARVRADGTVKEVTILGGHPLLAQALVRAVKLWRYQPASKETLELVKFTFSPQ
jgi:TonB family protein